MPNNRIMKSHTENTTVLEQNNKEKLDSQGTTY